MYGRQCPICGAYLDPCESCDCCDKKEAVPVEREQPLGKNFAVIVSVPSRSVKIESEGCA